MCHISNYVSFNDLVIHLMSFYTSVVVVVATVVISGFDGYEFNTSLLRKIH